MSYKDITSQSACALWGTRMAERDAARVQELERLHKVHIGDVVQIETEDTDVFYKRCRKKFMTKKAKVEGVYEHFILLRFENGLGESFSWGEFNEMRRDKNGKK